MSEVGAQRCEISNHFLKELSILKDFLSFIKL